MSLLKISQILLQNNYNIKNTDQEIINTLTDLFLPLNVLDIMRVKFQYYLMYMFKDTLNKEVSKEEPEEESIEYSNKKYDINTINELGIVDYEQ